MNKVEKVQDSDLNVIPSEYIEPYLAKFMGNMVAFFASAHLTKEEKEKIGKGSGWTVDEVKSWIKGVEVFVSEMCGIHARYAMMNEMYKMIDVPNEELKEICRKIVNSKYDSDE